MFDRLLLSIMHEIPARKISLHTLLAASKAFHIHQRSQPAHITILSCLWCLQAKDFGILLSRSCIGQHDAMNATGKWHTAAKIGARCGGSESALPSLVRDMLSINSCNKHALHTSLLKAMMQHSLAHR